MQRLAAEVNWPVLSHGCAIYYMARPTLPAQQPSIYLKLSTDGTTWSATNPTDGDTAADIVSSLTGSFDNTVFQYQSTHTKKGRVQRLPRITTPQTPSQVKFNMTCGVLDYRAGDVFVFQDA